MRSIDFCTPKPFPLEHSCSRRLPAQRPYPARCLSAPARGPLSSRSLAAPCPSTPASSLVCCAARPETRDAGTGWLGAPRCTMRLGRIALHGALPTSAPGQSTRDGVFFRPARRIRSPLTPLSPPPGSWARAAFWASPVLWLGGRQDRFRGGLVKGVRIPDPGSLPSAVATRDPLAPKHELNRVASLDRTGAHVMRIAELRRTAPLLPPVGPCAYAPEHRPRSGSRSRALVWEPGFRPGPNRSRASLNPKASFRLLQYDDARAPPRAVSRPRAAAKGDYSFCCLHLVPPPRGDRTG